MPKLRRLSTNRSDHVTSGDETDVVAQLSTQLSTVSLKTPMIGLFAQFAQRLSSIPLSDANVTVDQGIIDMKREKIIVNGLNFYGHDELTLPTLKLLVDRSASNAFATKHRQISTDVVRPSVPSRLSNGSTSASLSNNDDSNKDNTSIENQIYESVITRASRTATGGDCLFILHNLFHPISNDDNNPSLHDNLLIKTLPCSMHECLQIIVMPTAVPIESRKHYKHKHTGGQIETMIESHNAFGIYDWEDIAQSDGNAKPWFALGTVVTDIVTFSSSGVRDRSRSGKVRILSDAETQIWLDGKGKSCN